jgi:DNA gyrase inhibitor GyrI
MDVRIVELEPMRVASVLAYGNEPEMKAWEKMLSWAQSHHIMDKPHRAFGFNNPSPTPGSPNYGYEVWMTVAPDVQADDTVKMIDFSGGRYAVTRCVGVSNIFNTWQELLMWVENSPHRQAEHQWLEEHIKMGPDVSPDDYVLDLYLPIKAALSPE